MSWHFTEGQATGRCNKLHRESHIHEQDREDNSKPPSGLGLLQLPAALPPVRFSLLNLL